MIEELNKWIVESGDRSKEGGPYWGYIPVDLEVLPQWVLDQAKADGAEIDSPKMLEIYSARPRRFQSAIHLGPVLVKGEKDWEWSEHTQIIHAPTKIGKTECAMMEAKIEASHLVPICMQHDKGVDTGVPIDVTDANIARWGRWRHGVKLDNDVFADKDGTWDCGNIIGIGKYPKEKFAPAGAKIMILTTKMARDEKWWPDFKNKSKRNLPEGCIDTSKGNEGFDNEKFIVFFHGDREIHISTYETGPYAVEATDPFWLLILDEEPYSHDIWITGITHSKRRILIETPYDGLTWTKDLVRKAGDGHACYHAIYADSPYLTAGQVKQLRADGKPWDILARLYALYTAKSVRPFFDPVIVNAWRQTQMFRKTIGVFESTDIWREPLELTKLKVTWMPTGDKDLKRTCEMYEDVRIGVPYMIGIDTALGSVDPEGVGDGNTACVQRAPTENEGEDPITVLTLHSTLPVDLFAREVLQIARYFNNAIIAPEMGIRGASNGIFAAYTASWPYWFRMVITSDATNRQEEHKGFDTNQRTRPMLFALAAEYVLRNRSKCPLLCERLVDEMAACVIIPRGKTEGPDHTKGGSLDMFIAWAIGLYVFKYASHQVTLNNSRNDEDDHPYGRFLDRMGARPPQRNLHNTFETLDY